MNNGKYNTFYKTFSWTMWLLSEDTNDYVDERNGINWNVWYLLERCKE